MDEKCLTQNCWRPWQTFVLLLDLQTGKMSFCPIGFVLVDDHISEIEYETKIKAFGCKKAQFDCALLSEWYVQIIKPYRMELIDHTTKIFVCHHI